ncbi:MAG: hypothetical protein K2O93_00060, partial [Oscillospiraceae bacterium]|nr:hypothetical protein [Oscillospiraceae bacterium]
MQSKRSFFNRTLFRKNLTRYWPLWGTAALLGCLPPLYLLLGLLSLQKQYSAAGPITAATAAEFASILYAVTEEVVPVIAFFYAILAAMAVWGYLFSPRSVGLMHALPIDRTSLFVTGTFSGLSMLLIPCAVTGVLVCLIALVWGFMDFMAVCVTAASIVFLSLIFFGIATLCAMCAGHRLALPALYIVVNFFAVAAEILIRWVSSGLLFGVSEGSGDFLLEFLSPFTYLLQRLECRSYFGAAGEKLYYLDGFDTVVLYGLTGLALLALSWVLCCRRQSERAGDVVAFRWLRPLFRAAASAAGALGLGPLLYFLVWESFFQRGFYTDPVPLAVCMALTGLVGYYAASMLLEKSLRVFRGSAKGGAAVCLAAAAFCGLLTLDPMGISSWTPDPEELHAAMVYGEVEFSAGEGDALARKEAVIALQRAILEDKDSIRAHSDKYRDNLLWMRITYVLENGRTVQRNYYLPIREEQWESGESYEGFVRSMAGDRTTLRDSLTAPDGYSLTEVALESRFGGGIYAAVGDPELPGAEELYAALLQDLEEGNIPSWAPSFVGRSSARLPAELALYFEQS